MLPEAILARALESVDFTEFERKEDDARDFPDAHCSRS